MEKTILEQLENLSVDQTLSDPSNVLLLKLLDERHQALLAEFTQKFEEYKQKPWWKKLFRGLPKLPIGVSSETFTPKVPNRHERLTTLAAMDLIEIVVTTSGQFDEITGEYILLTELARTKLAEK